MSIWVSVYCRTKVGTIKPANLVAEIRGRVIDFSDLYAQEDPEDTLSRLRVETYKRQGDSALLHLHYLADGPPIVIDRVRRKTKVEEHVTEYLEERFGNRRGKRADLVRNHLAEVAEIVNFCLKQRHADGMGTPLTYAAAAWLAEVGDGLVRADDVGWMRQTDDGDFTVIAPE